MKAIVYKEFKGAIKLRDLPTPECPPDGVLIKVGATGICRSDWHGWNGHDQTISLPHVPGHEFAGTIEERGADVTQWEVGQRVTAPFVCGCGSCDTCTGGNPQVCPSQTQPGFTHWGSFAEYVVVRQADFNLVSIPDSVDFVVAAALGCRYGTAFRAVIDQGRLQAGELVGVFGCGGVGLSAIQIAKAQGARVLAMDVRDDKLALARQLGAEYTLNLAEEEYSPRVIKGMSGGLHLTIDALGNEGNIGNAIKSLRHNGRHVQVGLMENENTSIPMQRVISHELEILGSHGIQALRYQEIFDWIAEGKINPRKIVSGIISLPQAPRILERIAQQPPLGVVIIDMAM